MECFCHSPRSPCLCVCACVCVCLCVFVCVCVRARAVEMGVSTKACIYIYTYMYHIIYVCIHLPHWARCLVRRGAAPAACLWPRTKAANLARGSCVRASEHTLRRMSPLCIDSHTSITPVPCVRASVCCLVCRRYGSESSLRAA